MTAHLREIASPQQLKVLSAVEELGSMRKAANHLGVNESSVRKMMRALSRRAALQGLSPQHDMTKAVPAGYRVKGVSSLYNAAGELQAQWVKSRIDDEQSELILREFVESLVEDVKGKSPRISPPKASSDDLLCVYPLGDPHFGMYAWAEEAGADFDTALAESLTCSAIDRLVAAAPPATTAIVLPLGDYFHADDSTSRTPNSGAVLDTDTRWPKVMQAGLRALIYCVKAALAKHKQVIVRVVKGNHDTHASFALALAIDAYFSNNDRVTVDLSPSAMWYYHFGKVLIGATHGDTVKVAELPGVMAYDRPLQWGETKHRYWYLGHVHHQAQKEFPGVIVEQFRTLAARDAWHSGQGYRAGRDMNLLVHHRLHGEIERHRCDVGMLGESGTSDSSSTSETSRTSSPARR